MSRAIFESQLCRVWQNRWLDTAGLKDVEGRHIKIISPGRPNTDDRGPDFRDAVISFDDQVTAGDIEVHVTPQDWQAHGHHRDSAYDRVSLHVVMWHDGENTPTALSNGHLVPVLAIGEHIRAPSSVWWCDSAPVSAGGPCRDGAPELDEPGVLAIVESAGEARFAVKAAAFRRQIEAYGPAESLYQGMMKALGYARNQAPFLELSRRLPLRFLESSTAQMKGMTDGDCAARLCRVFQEASGTACCTCPGTGTAAGPASRTAQRQVAESSSIASAAITGWHLFRVRPNNSPAARLHAMALLLAGYRDHGLLEGVLGRVMLRVSGRRDTGLEHALIVPGLGRSRATDMVVNVILPFTHALGSVRRQEALCRQALLLYRGCGGTAWNSVTRHMAARLGLEARSLGSARCQQGLIHIYRTLCAEGGCAVCPLSKHRDRGHAQDEP